MRKVFCFESGIGDILVKKVVVRTWWFELLRGSTVLSGKGNMCEVLRSNFEDLFPKIEDAIISAEFLGNKIQQ